MAIAEKLVGNSEVRLCGLGPRDSLRLEAGLCLYGARRTFTFWARIRVRHTMNHGPAVSSGTVRLILWQDRSRVAFVSVSADHDLSTDNPAQAVRAASCRRSMWRMLVQAAFAPCCQALEGQPSIDFLDFRRQRPERGHHAGGGGSHVDHRQDPAREVQLPRRRCAHCDLNGKPTPAGADSAQLNFPAAANRELP